MDETKEDVFLECSAPEMLRPWCPCRGTMSRAEEGLEDEGEGCDVAARKEGPGPAAMIRA